MCFTDFKRSTCRYSPSKPGNGFTSAYNNKRIWVLLYLVKPDKSPPHANKCQELFSNLHSIWCLHVFAAAADVYCPNKSEFCFTQSDAYLSFLEAACSVVSYATSQQSRNPHNMKTLLAALGRARSSSVSLSFEDCSIKVKCWLLIWFWYWLWANV